MVPSWSSTIVLAMARPRPDPCLLFLDSSPTVNASNILFAISFEIPFPSSAIIIS